jgi:tetratricopeptide (TPR) repeat protein
MKIQMLSQQHSVANSQKINNNDESKGEDDSFDSYQENMDKNFNQLGHRQRRRSSYGKKSKSGQPSFSLDILHDFQYKSSCKEVTKLYRAANKLIKTLYAARTAMLVGDDNRAILCYNEVASIFLDKNFAELGTHKQDNKNIAICYNNIACIYGNQKEYEKQDLYFDKAIQIAIE